MANNETRIEKASKILGKATAKIAKDDLDLANRLTKVLQDEMQRIREGR